MEEQPAEPAQHRSLAEIAADLRAVTHREASVQAEKLRLVAEFSSAVEEQALAELASGPHVPGRPSAHEVAETAVTDEIMAVLGVGRGEATRWEALGTRLVSVLPATMTALEAGRLDMTRARAIAEATEVVDNRIAREVEAKMLTGIGDGPWDGPSPRTWRGRVERTVVGLDPDAAWRRRQRALAMRAVRAWTLGDGTGLLQLRAADTDIVFADQLVTDLANAEPDTAPDGTPLDMDQRRSDGLMRLFRRVREGGDLPRVHVRREREIGLVLHADTLFADGPAADAPGELRGLGSPAALDPATASEIARAEIARGTATQVLLTDGQGRLQRVVRLTHAPEDGWTRATLTEAVRTKLRDLPPLNTDGYQPTTAITEHVHARNPRCTAYDCPRSSRRSDLDHDEPWPRGPTDVSNLHPRCRRHHRLKTARLVQTRLGEHGAVTTTMLTGVRVPTAPEPLPGHAPGEGYAAGWKLAA